jgi:DUF1680 family protein
MNAKKTLAAAVALAIGFLGLGTVPAVAAVPENLDPSNQLLALSFDGDLADSSGNGRDATVGAGTANYVTGITGQAMSFNGSTYLTTGTDTALQPQDLTLSFWLNPASTLSGEHIIAWYKNAYNAPGWYLSSNSDANTLVLSVGTGSPQPLEFYVKVPRAEFFPAGQWTHVVVTFDHDTKTAKFYRNGVLVTNTSVSNTSSPGAIAASGVSELGANGPTHGHGGKLNASLDEYRLWSAIASTADVVGLYQEGVPGFDTTTVAQSDLDALSVPETAIMDIGLVELGALGSEITWSSSNTAVIADDGTVTRPTGSAVTVTLTASASYGNGPAVTKTFTVTVSAESSSGSEYSALYLSQSGMENVELVDAYMTNAGQLEIEYLLSFDTDRLLVEFRAQAGLSTGDVQNYGGWERGPSASRNPNGETNPTRFTGHFVGHYLSAVSEAYQSTIATDAQKIQLAAKLTAMVNGIREAQEAYALTDTANAGFLPAFAVSALPGGSGGLLVPFYNLHKVEQGLIDAAKYGPDQTTRDKALAAASDFAQFVVNWKAAHSSTNMLSTEYGGMNEALYNLFELTGNPVHAQAAHLFDETSLFTSLANGNDVLNGLHANTTIPKLTGAVKRYQVYTDNPDYYATLSSTEKAELETLYKRAAENFWQIVVDDHTYANGDNSQSEHFHAPDGLYVDATSNGDGDGGYTNNSTDETCNANNMLKLTRLLLQVTKQAKYSEYYEHTFINTILASQNPESGMTTYFQPMKAGYSKVFGTEYGEFWCCQGTGIENFAKLNDSLYFTDDDDIYVNMFRSSEFTDTRHSLKLTQTANVPKETTVTYEIEELSGQTIPAGTSLKLRKPQWVASEPVIKVNGAVQSLTASGDWYTVPVADGDTITYELEPKLQAIPAPDNANWVAFQYGPQVLAAQLSQTNVGAYAYGGVLVRVATFDQDSHNKSLVLVQDEATGAAIDPADWLADLDNNLERVDTSADDEVIFELHNVDDAAQSLQLVPYYSLYEYRYAMYLTLVELDSPEAQEIILQAKREARDADRTVDSLTSFDNNNSEFAKNVQSSSTSDVGTYSGASFRHDTDAVNGWFSYDLAIDQAAEHNYLGVRYTGADNARSLDIYIDGVKLKTYTITNAGGTGFYWDYTEIPAALIAAADNGDVTVKFAANGTSTVGGVYGVSILTSTSYSTASGLTSLTLSDGTWDTPFDPATTAYTVTLDDSATSVTLNAALVAANGYVRVGGVVIDETQPRVIDLPGDSKVVTVDAYAEDHSTYTRYTLTILKGDAEAPQGPQPIASFDFNNTTTGLAGSGAKAVAQGTPVLEDSYDCSKAASISSGFWLNVLKDNDTALLAGLNEVTFSYDAKPSTSSSNLGWTLFAVRSNATTTYPNEHYLGVMDKTTSVTVERLNSDGSSRIHAGSVSAVTYAETGWKHVDVVVTATDTKLYINGALQGTSTTTAALLTTILGSSGGYLQVGKANWESGEYFIGLLDNFKVYDQALGAADIAALAPTSFSPTCTGPTDAEAVAAAKEALAVTNAGAAYGNLYLPDDVDGVSVAWSSADPTVVTATGEVTRQTSDTDVVLTATLTKGTETDTKTITVHVKAKITLDPMEGYLFAYFTGNSVAGENIYFAASQGNDALHWTELNGGNYKFTSTLGEMGLRDPFIIRSPEGDTFYLIATDLSIGRDGDWTRAQTTGSRYLEVWESHDLVNWSAQRHVLVSPPTAGNTWAPEAYWDETLGEYVVFWASKLYPETDTAHSSSGIVNSMVFATTRDFVHFSEITPWQTGLSRIDSTVIKSDDVYYRFTKDEGGGGTGCSDIIQESSPNLRATLSGWTTIASCIGRDAGTSAVEGPSIFKSNPGDVNGDKFYLFVDEYGGRGYVPLATDDISDPDWQVPASYSLPASPRHGTVMPITADELEALTATAPVNPGDAETPVLHYTFDELAAGSLNASQAIADTGTRDTVTSGTVRNGNGQVVTGVSGKASDKAISLSGGTYTADSTATYVDLPNNIITSADTAVTVATWVKWTGSANGNCQWIWALGRSTSYNAFVTTSCNGMYGGVTDSSEKRVGEGSSLPANEWAHVAYVFDDAANTESLYLNGELLATTTASQTINGFIGTGSIGGMIGKSFYNDPFFGGLVDDFRIYRAALTAEQIVAVYAENAWEPLLAQVPFADGDTIRIIAGETRVLDLPQVPGITWTSDDPIVDASTGEVVAPSGGSQVVTLTVSNGTDSVDYHLTITTASGSDSYGYLMAHFIEDSAGYAEKVYLDISNGEDPTSWTQLNNGQPILVNSLNSTGLRDPYLVRNPETGKYYILGTDLRVFGCVPYETYNCSSGAWGAASDQLSLYLVIWESDNLVDWSEPRLLKVGQTDQRMAWAPEATWVPDRHEFIVYWSATIYSLNYTNVVYGFTSDFTDDTFTYGGTLIDKGHDVIDTTVYQLEKSGTTYTYRTSKDNGTNTIYMEVTTDTQWWLPGTTWTLIADGLGQADYGSVEGPLMFKDSYADKWYLFVDQYGGSAQGYRPYLVEGLGGPVASAATDITFTKLAAPMPGMASATKHGVVVALTVDEYKALRRAGEAQAVTGTAVTTEIGSAPTLPSTVEVVYATDTYGPITEQRPVVWDAVNPAQYAGLGTFTVTGTVSGVLPSGTGSATAPMTATATITVVAPVVHMTDLEAALVQLTALDPEDYTSVSWLNLVRAKARAEAVIAGVPTQTQVDDALADVQAAVNALVADLSVLTAVVDHAESLTAASYTAESWAALQAVLADANAALTDPATTRPESLDIAQQLAVALGALEPAGTVHTVVDKTALRALVEANVDLSGYTVESTLAYSAALVAGRAVLDDVTASQLDVDEAIATLIGAVRNLEWATPLEEFAKIGTPKIKGTKKVGKTLTISSYGKWEPMPNSYSYQWYRNGVAIAGADQATYDLVAADRGSKITVQVVGKHAGFIDTLSKMSSKTSKIGYGTLTAKTVVQGVAADGQTLTADTSGWTAGTAFTYQWYRNSSKIAGATSATYTLTPSEIGKTVKVKVTGIQDGYKKKSQTSAKTAKVAQFAFTATPAPVIVGTPAVGSPVAADVGTWTPTPSSYTFQWYLDGKAIKKATKSSYVPVAKDSGKQLTVKVTAKLAGYATITLLSDPVAVA